MSRASALTVAGSDSAGDGGLQADLRAFEAIGVRGGCAVTAVTARNGVEVTATHEVPAAIVAAQIDAVLRSLAPGAVKVGLMTTVPSIRAVARALGAHRGPIVVDPVMIGRGGRLPLRATSIHALVRSLLPLATLATPNRNEAALLAGFPILGEADLKTAARRIQSLGPHAVLVMGAWRDETHVADLLLDGRTYLRILSPRVAAQAAGRGDTLSAAITAFLALGETLPDAVVKGRAFLQRSFASAD